MELSVHPASLPYPNHRSRGFRIQISAALAATPSSDLGKIGSHCVLHAIIITRL